MSRPPSLMPHLTYRPESTEAEKQQSDDRFRLLVSEVKDYAILMLDPQGHVVSWNAGAERIKGYRAEEILGQHFSRFYLAEDLEQGKPEYELKVATEEGRFEDEGWRVRKDGSQFWANVVITALRDETGQLLGFGKVTRDITERKRAEEALRESEERIRLLVSEVKGYAILILDPQGHVASWNAGAERIKGYRAEEILGQHFSRFYPAEDVEQGKPDYELKVATEEGRFEDEGWRVRKDGSQFWANVVITALRDQAGQLRGFGKVTRDMTERKRTEEEILFQNAQLEAANKEMETFCYSVSHDLRAPLRGIDGFSSALLEDYGEKLEGAGKEYLSRVRAAAKRMGQLIDDLLSLSRVKRVEMRMEEVDLSALAKEIAAELHRQCPDRKVSFSIAEGLMAKCDAHLIRVALENLLGNAWKFTSKHPNAMIQFGALERDGQQEYFVSDNGAGFDSTFADKLFKAFQRLHTPDEFEGSGIGLVSVQGIVDRHGGRIWAQGTVGKGATFYFTLSQDRRPR